MGCGVSPASGNHSSNFSVPSGDDEKKASKKPSGDSDPMDLLKMFMEALPPEQRAQWEDALKKGDLL